MTIYNTELSKEIQDIFDKNKIDDLNNFISKRQLLNRCNVALMYLFYLFQSGGVFVTTIATGYNLKTYIWLGIGLNLIASLIHVYEKINTSLSEQILKDIEQIRNGSYIDDGIRIIPPLENPPLENPPLEKVEPKI
jgi:hypothetical protein